VRTVDVGGPTRVVMLNQSDMLANDPDYKKVAHLSGHDHTQEDHEKRQREER
jgi:hypothetical protein